LEGPGICKKWRPRLTVMVVPLEKIGAGAPNFDTGAIMAL